MCMDGLNSIELSNFSNCLRMRNFGTRMQSTLLPETESYQESMHETQTNFRYFSLFDAILDVLLADKL